MSLSRSGLSVVGMLLAAAWGSCMPQMAVAQNQNMPAIVTPIAGTVDGLAPGGLISFDGADTNKYMVKLVPNAKFWVHGEAEREFLKPGMTVLFSASLNKQQTLVDGEISELTIFTPSEDYQIGFYEDVGRSLDDDKKEGNAEQPAIGAGLDSPAFGGGEGSGTGPYRVGGVIKTIRNNQLMLLVGKKKVRAELAEDLVVKLEVSDLSAVTKGARISVVRGRIAGPGKLLADEVDVTLMEPLAAPTKKGRKSKTSAAERKAAKEAAEDNDKLQDAAAEIKNLDD